LGNAKIWIGEDLIKCWKVRFRISAPGARRAQCGVKDICDCTELPVIFLLSVWSTKLASSQISVQVQSSVSRVSYDVLPAAKLTSDTCQMLKFTHTLMKAVYVDDIASVLSPKLCLFTSRRRSLIELI